MQTVVEVEKLNQADYTKPFVIRNYLTSTNFEHSVLKHSDVEVFGYNTQNQVVEHLLVGDLYCDWLVDRLQYKVLDAPLTILSLDPLLQENQCLVLTSAPGYTALHIDPPAYGGGWMWLASGQKTWTLIEFHLGLSELFNVEDKTIDDRSDEALLNSLSIVYQTTTQPGDFIYFPPGWLHRVVTTEKSLGLGGYITQTGVLIDSMVEELASHNLDYIWPHFKS